MGYHRTGVAIYWVLCLLADAVRVVCFVQWIPLAPDLSIVFAEFQLVLGVLLAIYGLLNFPYLLHEDWLEFQRTGKTCGAAFTFSCKAIGGTLGSLVALVLFAASQLGAVIWGCYLMFDFPSPSFHFLPLFRKLSDRRRRKEFFDALLNWWWAEDGENEFCQKAAEINRFFAQRYLAKRIRPFHPYLDTMSKFRKEATRITEADIADITLYETNYTLLTPVLWMHISKLKEANREWDRTFRSAYGIAAKYCGFLCPLYFTFACVFTAFFPFIAFALDTHSAWDDAVRVVTYAYLGLLLLLFFAGYFPYKFYKRLSNLWFCVTPDPRDVDAIRERYTMRLGPKTGQLCVLVANARANQDLVVSKSVFELLPEIRTFLGCPQQLALDVDRTLETRWFRNLVDSPSQRLISGESVTLHT